MDEAISAVGSRTAAELLAALHQANLDAAASTRTAPPQTPTTVASGPSVAPPATTAAVAAAAGQSSVDPAVAGIAVAPSAVSPASLAGLLAMVPPLTMYDQQGTVSSALVAPVEAAGFSARA